MNTDAIKHINLEFPYRDETRRFTITLNLEEYSHRSMWNHFNSGQLYEPETSRLLIGLLEPGDSFIDIGGHIGYFSLLAAAIVGPSGKILTFEPETTNQDRLRANISDNHYNNINLVPCAVGESTEDVQFYINQDNDGGHAMWDISRHEFNIKSRENTEIRTVPQTTLDLYLQNTDLGKLRMIKMDVEGSELKVLRGAKQTLLKYQLPFIIAEVNRYALAQLGSSEEDLRSYMSELGYEAYVPTETHIAKLKPGEYYDYNYVFNLLFAAPGRLPV